MKCPRCGEYAIEKKVNTDMDKASMVWTRTHPAATAAALALQVGSAAAKTLLSKTYQCTECNHRFRKWLQ